MSAKLKPKTSIFGRTDLRKGVSEAKFYVEVDFDVEKSLVPPKSAENHKKPQVFRTKVRKRFFDVKKSKVANRPKRVFPKFRADRSQVRGANGRSKFEFLWSNTFEILLDVYCDSTLIVDVTFLPEETLVANAHAPGADATLLRKLTMSF